MPSRLRLHMRSAAVLAVLSCFTTASKPALSEIFAAGERNPNGLNVTAFRIPGFVSLNETLIVLAEARKYSLRNYSPLLSVLHTFSPP